MKQPSLGTVFQVLVLTAFNCGSITGLHSPVKQLSIPQMLA